MNAYSDSLQLFIHPCVKVFIVALCTGSSGQLVISPLLSRSNVVSCLDCVEPGGALNAACGGVFSYPV